MGTSRSALSRRHACAGMTRLEVLHACNAEPIHFDLLRSGRSFNQANHSKMGDQPFSSFKALPACAGMTRLGVLHGPVTLAAMLVILGPPKAEPGIHFDLLRSGRSFNQANHSKLGHQPFGSFKALHACAGMTRLNVSHGPVHAGIDARHPGAAEGGTRDPF